MVFLLFSSEMKEIFQVDSLFCSEGNLRVQTKSLSIMPLFFIKI